MADQENKKANYNGVILIVIAVVIFAALVLAFMKNNNKKQSITTNPDSHQHIMAEADLNPDDLTIEQIASRIESFGLSEIAAGWKGKQVPDFTLKDLSGKEHKLSNYKGKDVLITFWATWCPPCQKEIPELINIRKKTPEDSLKILAISNENIDKLKDFKESRGINYTILQAEQQMAEPYNLVRYIPSAFFIDKDGKIKLAVTGPMSEETINAIFKAQ